MDSLTPALLLRRLLQVIFGSFVCWDASHI